MQLSIITQYQENYGAHDWDGEGECPQYWKFKGGTEYMIVGIPLSLEKFKEICDPTLIIHIANKAKIGYSNIMSKEYIVHWSIEDDNYVPQYEKDQIEFQGEVRFPEPRINFSDLSVAF